MMKGNGQKRDPNLPKQERSRTRWTSSQDQIFADLVVEQIQEGHRSNNMFDQKAWLNIREKFNAQTGLNFNKKQLRKHLEVLRTRYDNLKSATEQNVFNLEESNRMILPDYGIWGELMEELPKRETLKIKDCPIFSQLCLIFNDAGSDGKYAQSSHYEGMEANATVLDSPYASSIPKLEVEHITIVSKTPTTTRNATNASKKRKKRSSDTPQDDSKNQEMLTEAMAKALSDMVSASTIRTASTIETGDRFSISSCITMLDEIQGLNQSLYFAALDLFDYPSCREIFMSLQRDQHIGWLQDACVNTSSSVLM